MTEVPEHLLRRSRERRKALGLPVPGEEGDEGGEEAAPAEAPAAGEQPAEATAAAAAGAPAAGGGEDVTAAAAASGVPAHLLERSKRRRAQLTGDGGDGGAAEPAAAAAATTGGGATATATAPKPTPTATGPGGHTQRLLTVVKSGSIQQTRAEAQDKVHVWPHLLAIEFAAILSLTAFVTIFSALVKAPLLSQADVNRTPNPSKAPWYFLGLQELLKMFHPMVAGVMIPGIALAVFAVTPYVDNNPSHKPNDRKFAIIM